MFYQLIHIQTVILCSLWISTAPTQADWVNNCPAVNWGWGALPPITGLADVDTWLLIRAVDLETGEIHCEVAAFHNLAQLPCGGMIPVDRYRLDMIFKDAPHLVCTAPAPDLSLCSEIPEGVLEWRGPYPVYSPDPVAPCELPGVDNTMDLTTMDDYQLLGANLAWWGVRISPQDWQNRFDEQIRGAADAARIPADLLKSMIAAESQFWPLWSGDAGEIGWLQVTREGLDTALRYSPELFDKYCSQAIDIYRCFGGYELLRSWEKGAIQEVILADLQVSGVPTDAAAQAADDLWISAMVLRGFACYAMVLAPDLDTWDAAVVLYNAGESCLVPGGYCEKGKDYLIKVKQ